MAYLGSNPPPSNSHHYDYYYIFSRESPCTSICHCYWVGGGVDPWDIHDSKFVESLDPCSTCLGDLFAAKAMICGRRSSRGTHGVRMPGNDPVNVDWKMGFSIDKQKHPTFQESASDFDMERVSLQWRPSSPLAAWGVFEKNTWKTMESRLDVAKVSNGWVLYCSSTAWCVRQ